MIEEEEDYNRRTPRVLSSDGEDSCELEDRPFAKNPKHILEELIEESREESMILGTAEANGMLYVSGGYQQQPTSMLQLDKKMIEMES